MIIITNEAELAAAALEPPTRALIDGRCRELLSGGLALSDIVNWIVVAPGDSLAVIETAIGFPINGEGPPWEWVEDHGVLYEAPIILSDDGFGVVLIVPDDAGVNATLLEALRRDANT
jgi:hypothetical protein